MKAKKAMRSLGRREKAELSRMGAKAAARGEPATANPMDLAENLPESTGESRDDWQKRRHAWQAGFEQQSAVGHDTRPPTTQGRDDEHD